MQYLSVYGKKFPRYIYASVHQRDRQTKKFKIRDLSLKALLIHVIFNVRG